MGARKHIHGWGPLALFQALALVVLLGFQGAAAGDALAERNQEREEQAGSARECEISEVATEDRPDAEQPKRELESARDEDSCPGSEDAEADEDGPRDQGSGGDDQADPEDGAEAEDGDDEAEPEDGVDQAEPEDGEDQADPESHDQADPEDGGDQAEPQGDDQAEPQAQGPDEEAAAGDELPDGDVVEESIETPAPGAETPEVESPEPVVWPTVFAGADGSSGGSRGDKPDGPGRTDGDGKKASRAPDPPARAEKTRTAPISVAEAASGYDLQDTFSSAALLDALPPQAELEARNSIPEVAPFIIAGPASWTDSWGAPRFGPGSLMRTHEGQDVFCRYGDPVLASERGYLEFDEGGLGGKVARIRRADGSYWYYAHLAAWNSAFASGDRVAPGDVLGYCGNSGNAAGTPPHVHFGFYGANGRAIDPMPFLVRWLRAAERRLVPASMHSGNRAHPQRLKDFRQIPAVPRLLGEDAFGDASAPQVELVAHRLTEASSAPPRVPFAVVAAAVLALSALVSFRSAPLMAGGAAAQQTLRPAGEGNTPSQTASARRS